MIRQLEKKIIKQGFEYKQIQREGNIAIYSQTCNKKLLAYETIVIKQSPPHFASKNTEYTLIELYPSAEQFGLNGWSYRVFDDLYDNALKRAQQKFDQLKQHTT